MTVCYLTLLVEMGFKIATANRKTLDKALNVISVTSLETLYTSSTPDKTVFLRLIKYKKNQNQFADLHINPVSVFYYYSNPILGFDSCISCIRQEISKTFRLSAPTYTFAIFFYIITQLKNVSPGKNEKFFIEDFRSRHVVYIKKIFEIIISTLINKNYIKCIKHKEKGFYIKDPIKMLNYFKETLINFKTPEKLNMPLLFTEIWEL